MVDNPMDDKTYNELVERAFERIDSALEQMDPDDVEGDRGGGYLTLQFRDASRCVISTQRPVREIWMAADRSAWHFGYEAASGRWVAGKTGEELFATVAALIGGKVGRAVKL